MRKFNAVHPTLSCSSVFFVQNVVDLTISPIRKELDLHVGSDGDLREHCKVIVVVVIVHMNRLPVNFVPFISYFIYTLKVTIMQC